jgi:hypothetical protein
VNALHPVALESNLFVPPRLEVHSVASTGHMQAHPPTTPEGTQTEASGGGGGSVLSGAVEAVKNVLKKPLSFLARTLSSDSEDSGETERKLCKQQDIDALVDMGYNPEVAAWALMENDHNLPLAVEALMRSEHASGHSR